MARTSVLPPWWALNIFILSWAIAGCTFDLSLSRGTLTSDLPSISDPIIDDSEDLVDMPSAAFGNAGLVTTNFTRVADGGASDTGQSAAIQVDGKIVVVGTSEDSAPVDFSVHRYNTDGSLDSSFGENGIVLTDMNSGSYDYAEAVVIQTDGKIIAVGLSVRSGVSRFALARYNTDGSLDTSFGGTGKVFSGMDGVTLEAKDVALQADGKILVVGNTFVAGTTDFAVFRFNTDGSLDTSFGGTGQVITDTGSTESARSVAIQDDGKIVVGGFSGISGNNDFAVFRYNTDGSLDSSFGTAGMAFVNFDTTRTDIGDSLGLQSDGKIVIAGWHLAGIAIRLALTRLNTDGTLDTTYGTTGKTLLDITAAYWDQGLDLVIQSDDKAVVASSSFVGGYEFITLRFGTNGVLDTGFGGTGRIVTGFAAGSRDSGYGLVLDADQNIITVGSTDLSGSYDFALLRQNPDGSLDNSFGTNGKSNAGSASYLYSDDAAYATALQTDGKLIVAGYSGDPLASVDFAVIRYNIDGSLDSTFGINGKVVTDIDSGSNDYPYAVAIQSDGKILLAGTTSGVDTAFATVRYEANGSLDASFGTGGIVTTRFGVGSTNFASAMALQSDGKILVTGTTTNGISSYDVVVARYLQDGSPDNSFGFGGRVITEVNPTYDEDVFRVNVQEDGRILILGNAYNGSSPDFMLLRYTSAGVLDSSFGASGIVLLDIDTNSADSVADLKVQSDGKILIAGSTDRTGDPDITLVRLTTAGALDTDFGTSGKVIFALPGGTSEEASALALASNGQIYISGNTDHLGNRDFMLVNFNPDGSLNTTFGSGNGWLTTKISPSGSDWANAMTLHPNGSLFVVGTSEVPGEDFAVVKYNPDGTR